MMILPAIDMRGGRCVRLVQGDYDRETVFEEDPAVAARRWLSEGAEALHLVDLDGARGDAGVNRSAVERILAAVEEHVRDGGARPVVELGGGIRTEADVAGWLDAGVSRVILGTVAVTSPEVVERSARRYPGKVWVGIDARDGRVAISGWMKDSGVDALELARTTSAAGAGGLLYTDIDRDGTGRGVNVDATARLARAVDIPVLASGGVHSVEHIHALRPAVEAGVSGVVVGRALYDGTTTLAELIQAAGQG